MASTRRARFFCKLCVKAFADVAARQEVAILAEEGGGVDREQQAHRGLIDCDALHGFRGFQIGHGVPNLKSVHPRDRAEVATSDVVNLLLAQAREHVQFFRADFFVAFAVQRV